MSLCIIVTRFACIAHRFLILSLLNLESYVSSNKCTRNASVASWIACSACDCHRNPPGCPTNPCTKSCEISRTYHYLSPRHRGIPISKKVTCRSMSLYFSGTFEFPWLPVSPVDSAFASPLERDHQLYIIKCSEIGQWRYVMDPVVVYRASRRFRE